MIWFEELQNRKKISRIFSAYESTFPIDERRSKEQFLELAENPDVYILSIKSEEEAVGYMILWKIHDFYFLEHFEVFEEFRNRKYGSLILEELIEKYEKIILESEPSSLSEMASRRIDFYERNSFKILTKDYIQPSYGEGKNSLTLWLLSNSTEFDVEKTIKEIYKIVYQK